MQNCITTFRLFNAVPPNRSRFPACGPDFYDQTGLSGLDFCQKSKFFKKKEKENNALFEQFSHGYFMVKVRESLNSFIESGFLKEIFRI